MAKAKLVPECAICFDEEGSYGCVRPSHNTYKGVEEPVTTQVLATAILTVSDSVAKLYKSGLNRRAVVALLADDTKLGKKTIETVLDSLLNLRKTYTKDK